MQKLTRRALLAAAVLLAGGVGTALAQDATVPAGYPADYSKIIEASKSEPPVAFYSSIAKEQMQPMFDAFSKLYPWINVQYLELSSGDVITRYLTESSTGTPTASLLFSSDVDGWAGLVSRQQIREYKSPEAGALPPRKVIDPSIYVGGGDPYIFIWNKLLVPDDLQPAGLADLVDKVKAHPEVFNGKLTAYGADLSSSGYNVHYALAQHHGDKIWDWYKVLGPQTTFERSVGGMVEKVLSGEYVLGYGVAAETPNAMIQDPATAKILGVGYLKDGSPLGVRHIAVTKGGPSPNSAELLMDFMLSKPGQILLSGKGKLPGRMDITPDDIGGGETLNTFMQDIGGDANLALIDFDDQRAAAHDDFVAKWKAANAP